MSAGGNQIDLIDYLIYNSIYSNNFYLIMNPGRALWYALKVEDYDLAEFLISSSTDIR